VKKFVEKINDLLPDGYSYLIVADRGLKGPKLPEWRKHHGRKGAISSSMLKVRSRILGVFMSFPLRFAFVKLYSLTLFFEVFRWKDKNSIGRL